MIIKRSDNLYFDDLATYIIFIVATTLTIEIYQSEAAPYKENHKLKFDAKQVPRRLIIYPFTLLNDFFINHKWPQELRIEEVDRELPPESAKLGLGMLEKIFSMYSSAFANYYEKNINTIRSKFGYDTHTWPTVWNFARVVRNAFYHNGCINFDNQNAKVNWNRLTYEYSDNGKAILNTDIWPGDLIYLMMEMDTYL